MMTTAVIHYTGNLHTDMTHLQSDTTISTDAPTDNGGQGAAFSPTDLVASALGGCMLTIMGLKAASMGIEFSDVRAEVTKTMSANPRRISAVDIAFYINHDYPEATRKRLEAVAHACPVAQSLHPDIAQNLSFHYA
ncbi:OsmC family protein [Suttonella sp. R2A3]|uniref:OsmC family protein n=1 Tax=Suttonella sp. R2A3 TaxID=2908648 RepID=UPI001F255C70|nr:OsmC family protein [Suttonella sp. R2A3]UJF24750.1 OsmC family protein [Suttonella sp. R2A3]